MNGGGSKWRKVKLALGLNSCFYVPRTEEDDSSPSEVVLLPPSQSPAPARNSDYLHLTPTTPTPSSSGLLLPKSIVNSSKGPYKHFRGIGVSDGGMSLSMNLKLSSAVAERTEPVAVNNDEVGKRGGKVVDLGNGSQVVYISRFLSYDDSWNFFDYLNKHIPWTRPTIRVFGRPFLQPRDVCYVATEGLTVLTYSGYRPHAYSWVDFPPLKEILDAVHKAFPGDDFNSLLLNRYKGGNDYVGWHADDEKLYGPTPEIASVSFGCERDFFLKKKPCKISQGKSSEGEPPSKRAKKNVHLDQHSFNLKHGSLLLMRGYTQRDWLHSVPKRAKAESVRINLTFRHVVE